MLKIFGVVLLCAFWFVFITPVVLRLFASLLALIF